MPRVSVCIPTYNRSDYLQYSVNSVLNQTYSDFELIICDDGSTDNTAEIVDNFKDNRIIYIQHKKNIGKSNNMRSGFEKATGEYFLKLDDDDGLTPEFLEKTVNILNTNHQIDFVGTDHWIIDSKSIRNESITKINSEKWGRNNLEEGIVKDLLEKVFIKQVFQIGATLFRKKILDEVDFLLPNIQNCEDNDLFVRLALNNKNGYYLPLILMEYRFHEEQNTLDRSIVYLEDYLNYLNRFNFNDKIVEDYRKTRINTTTIFLALRLIEQGQTTKGRKYIKELISKKNNSLRVYLGLVLSYFPLVIRQDLFKLIRRLKPKDYAEQVRSNS